MLELYILMTDMQMKAMSGMSQPQFVIVVVYDCKISRLFSEVMHGLCA